MACCSTQEENSFEWSPSSREDGLQLHQLETALMASHQREEALKQIVEQQRTEIDKLRSLVNSLQLQESLRQLAVTPPSRRRKLENGMSPVVAEHYPPAVSPSTAACERPAELDLGPSFKRLRIED